MWRQNCHAVRGSLKQDHVIDPGGPRGVQRGPRGPEEYLTSTKDYIAGEVSHIDRSFILNFN